MMAAPYAIKDTPPHPALPGYDDQHEYGENQRGGAREWKNVAKRAVEGITPINQSIKTNANIAIIGAAMWMYTVELAWHAQAQSGECAT
ncbi:MAG TPA: hypothetical protein VKB33_09860 [Nitrospira sp.]|nr:hypothetical protein [Nitrospira sp.]